MKQSLAPFFIVVPTTGFALGLGDIRVGSALNEPLSAEIEIVSATPEDLLDLSAAIPSREIFQRYGAERPSFLSSARFKVTRNSEGHPVLRVTSDEAFTEPVVSLLVDLRWHNGELIREYPLLLDPADLPARAQALARIDSAAGPAPSSAAGAARTRDAEPAAAPATAQRAAAVVQPRRALAAPAPSLSGEPVDASTTAVRHYRVGPRDTLRNVARRVSPWRGKVMLQRTMIAIFRANRPAFDDNINRLHRGAVLAIPSRDEIAAISPDEARREVRAQMAAWHRPTIAEAPALAAANPSLPSAAQRATAPETRAAASEAPPVPSRPSPSRPSQSAPSPSDAGASPLTSASAALAAASVQTPAAGTANDSLEKRIQSLEQALDDTRRMLSSQHATLQHLQQLAEAASTYPASAAKTPVASDAQTDTTEAVEPPLSRGALWSLIGGAFALVSFTAWKWRSKRAHVPPGFPRVERTEHSASVLDDSPFATPFKEHAVKPSPSIPASIASGAAAPREARAVMSAATASTSPVPTAPRSAAAASTVPASTRSTSTTAASMAPAATAPKSTTPVSTSPVSTRLTSTTPASTTAASTTAAATAANAVPEAGTTTVSIVIDGSVGDHTVNLSPPTEQIPIDTARLIALTELERELEASYDPTATDVIQPLRASASTSATTTTHTAVTTPVASVAGHTGATAQHVQMPSKLSERPVVGQERTNIIEVLRKAIEADPRRLDLRLKLLEIYFSSVSAHREEFVEVARKLARSGEILTTSDWEKVSALSSQSEPAAAETRQSQGKLADCA